MGVKERRQREKEAREQAILTAAKKLFISQGYEGTTIESVADELELSKRTIYLYFESKEELYYAVARPGLEIMARMFKDAANKGDNGLNSFAGIGIAYAEFWNKHQDYRRLLNGVAKMNVSSKPGPQGEEFERASLENLRIMISTIEAGIRDGSIRSSVDPMLAAICISSSMEGVLQNLESNKEKLESFGLQREMLIAETLNLFGRALAAQEFECGPDSKTSMKRAIERSDRS